MQFQYQYTPNDLAVIREAQNRIHYSPGTTITVWALGLAVCLLVLAAVGSWSLVSGIGTFAAIFIVFYVYVLTRKNVGNRETLVRTLTINEKRVSESYLNSEFHRTWTSIQKTSEADDHFLFAHYETILALPKRAISIDQMDAVRKLIARQVDGGESPRELDEYRRWFSSESGFPIYRFAWTDDDVQKVYESQMQEFDRTKSTRVPRPSPRGNWLTIAVAVPAALLLSFLMFYLSGQFNHLPATQVWLKIFFVPLALGCPFILGFLWWKFTVTKSRETPLKIPLCEISVRLTDTDLLIGFPEAVSRYGWQDINSFVFSEHFVGFRPKNGLIHVISNRAFGGCENALEFLRTAEQLRQQATENAATFVNASLAESGNPYQSPTKTNH